MTENQTAPEFNQDTSEEAGKTHVDGMMSAAKVFLFSVVRSVTPIIVGWILSLFVFAGIPVEGLETAIEGLVVAVLSAAYYICVRLLEVYVSPKLGWLLGVAVTPDSYSK